jgi:hypothetical protein
MVPPKFFKYIFIAMVLIILNSNYAMSKRSQDDETQDRKFFVAMNKKVGVETFIDTLNRGKELALTGKDFTPIIPEATAVTDDKSGKAEVPNGFRVQCLASSQIDRVRSEQKLLESKMHFPVYIIFAAPYYKLLVGDFIKRPDAENACVKMKELGYSDAWVMRTKVWVKP